MKHEITVKFTVESEEDLGKVLKKLSFVIWDNEEDDFYTEMIDQKITKKETANV